MAEGSAPGTELSVTSQPVAIRPWCYALSVFLLAAFGTIAAILRSTTDGVTFGVGDQVSMGGIGIALAAAALLPLRPRLSADATGVTVRGVLGSPKVVPWELIRGVEFRPRWRWARLVLPADETISLYAVQRFDGPRSVHVMRVLRDLHARYGA